MSTLNETITAEDMREILKQMTETIEENKDYLSELDAALGDGDHGASMVKSFQAVTIEVEKLDLEDVGLILQGAATALMSAVGGAVGPLFGTAFLRASQEAIGKKELTLNDLIAMFQAAEIGVKERGKAKLGDKTMLDAIHPATQAIKEASENGDNLLTAVEKSVHSAREGMKATIPLLSKVGRSSRLGERSIGHQDPGATSCYLLLQSFYQTLEELHQKIFVKQVSFPE